MRGIRRVHQVTANGIVKFRHLSNGYELCSADFRCVCNCPSSVARRRLTGVKNVYPRRSLHEETVNSTAVYVELKIKLPAGYTLAEDVHHAAHSKHIDDDDDDDDDALTSGQTIIMVSIVAVFGLGIAYYIMGKHDTVPYHALDLPPHYHR